MSEVIQLIWAHDKKQPRNVNGQYPLPYCMECYKKPPEISRFLILDESKTYCSECVMKFLDRMPEQSND